MPRKAKKTSKATIKTKRQKKFDHVILYQHESFRNELWARLPRVKAEPILLPWVINDGYEKEYKDLKVFLFSGKRKHAEARVEIGVERDNTSISSSDTSTATLYVDGSTMMQWFICQTAINRMPRTFYVAMDKIKQHFHLHDFDPVNKGEKGDHII